MRRRSRSRTQHFVLETCNLSETETPAQESSGMNNANAVSCSALRCTPHGAGDAMHGSRRRRSVAVGCLAVVVVVVMVVVLGVLVERASQRALTGHYSSRVVGGRC
jgi:hypothetical protein